MLSFIGRYDYHGYGSSHAYGWVGADWAIGTSCGVFVNSHSGDGAAYFQSSRLTNN